MVLLTTLRVRQVSSTGWPLSRCVPKPYIHASLNSEPMYWSVSGEEGASTDVHCNPLYSEAKMKEIRRNEALARVTRMLNDHMGSTSGQASQNGTPRSGLSAQAGAFFFGFLIIKGFWLGFCLILGYLDLKIATW